jgi:hypothetical protein
MKKYIENMSVVIIQGLDILSKTEYESKMGGDDYLQTAYGKYERHSSFKKMWTQIKMIWQKR